VHARRCSGVLCAKQGADEVVADNKASDTRHCVKVVRRSGIHFGVLRSSDDLPSVIESRYPSERIVIHTCRGQRL
jgi:hypothetical protein